MKFLKKLLEAVKKHWALTSATLLATAAAIAVVALVIFFPPALPAIIAFTGVTIAGFAPFAFLANMSVLAAAATLGGIAAAAVLAGSTVTYNVVTGVGRWFKNLFSNHGLSDKKDKDEYHFENISSGSDTDTDEDKRFTSISTSKTSKFWSNKDNNPDNNPDKKLDKKLDKNLDVNIKNGSLDIGF